MRTPRCRIISSLPSLSGIWIMTVILGVVTSGLWVGLYQLTGVATLSVLLTGLVAGYIISSIVFYSPFGMYIIRKPTIIVPFLI